MEIFLEIYTYILNGSRSVRGNIYECYKITTEDEEVFSCALCDLFRDGKIKLND